MTAVDRPAASVDEVFDLFDGFACDPYDEEVTQLEHALQTAALAHADGADDALVAAALLHDVGHLLALRDAAGSASAGMVEARVDGEEAGGFAVDGGPVDLHHEARGARWLARLLPPTVTGPIALHVAAKRYVCAVDADYHGTLSSGSVASLVRQGGPMGEDEVARFRSKPAHVEAIRLRRWDDAGKVTAGVVVPDLASYRPLLERLART